jgi:hypothetical protein
MSLGAPRRLRRAVLDRLGRNLKRSVITLLDDVQALGIAFVSLAEGIDATTPAGKRRYRCALKCRCGARDGRFAGNGQTLRGAHKTLSSVP